MNTPEAALPLHVQCRQFLLGGLGAGMSVLDVGCGRGELLAELAQRGCTVRGVEINPALVEACRASGLTVDAGAAEQLPIASESHDAIVCSVVLPYTDERKAVAEWARVLRPGGVVLATYHGTGYGVNYILNGGRFATRCYGLRMLANTACCSLTNRRLPGFLGDTQCQTARRLARHYRHAGLTLVEQKIVGHCAGLPMFICHRLEKR